MRIALVEGQNRSYQRVKCTYGIKSDKNKMIWIDVTDSDFFTSESVYRFRKPVSCAACDDKATDCPVCEDDNLNETI